MKAVEILQIGREILKMMSECGIRVEDYKYADLYREYEEMRSRGDKYWYVINYLACKYKVSESKAVRIIRRLSRDVKT